MPNILVRDVPAEVHDTLQHWGERRGQSLQQYLATELRRLAERPSLDEVLDRIDACRHGRAGFSQAVEDVLADRAER